MEEMEITSWLALDALKKFKRTEIIETVGNLQTGHSMSVFCIIEDDHLELGYSDLAANFLRRYDDRDEFDLALEERKEEVGEAVYEDEERDFGEDEAAADEDEDGTADEVEAGDEDAGEAEDLDGGEAEKDDDF